MRSIILSTYVLLFLMGALGAARLKIRVDYRIAQTTHPTRDIIKDNSWEFQLVEPPTIIDPEKYYIVLNFDANVKEDETIYLRGFYAEPNELLLGHSSSLVLKNEEDITREFVVVNSEGEVIKTLVVKPNSSLKYLFDESGDYKIKDTLYLWNTIKITVMDDTQQVYQIDRRTKNISINNIASGSYNLKIYRGTNWIFQEDFTVVVSSNEFPLSYIIKEGDVIRTNTPDTPLINIGIDGVPQ